MQASAQAGIEDFNGIFQERLRGIVRDGLLAIIEQEVTSLCGETYRPTASVHRRAVSEMVTTHTTSGKELISKRRLLLVRDGSEAIAKAVRDFWPDAVQQECWCMLSVGCAASFLGSIRARWCSA